MFISDKHRFIFFHIPKTAGSFVEKKLAQMLGEPDWRTEWSCEAWGNKFLKNGKTNYIKHMRPFAFQRNDPDRFKDYYKFAIVRNPWAWHLSFFSMITQWKKFSSVDGHHAKNHGGRIHPLNDYKSFEEFIKLGAREIGPPEGVAHLSQMAGNPCHRFLQNSRMPQAADPKAGLMVDDVLSFDDLQKGIDQVTQKIGIDPIDMNDRDSSTIEGRGEPIDCSSKHRHYSEEYDQEMAQIIAQLNYIDIQKFKFKYGGGK